MSPLEPVISVGRHGRARGSIAPIVSDYFYGIDTRDAGARIYNGAGTQGGLSMRQKRSRKGIRRAGAGVKRRKLPPELEEGGEGEVEESGESEMADTELPEAEILENSAPEGVLSRGEEQEEEDRDIRERYGRNAGPQPI